MLRSKVESSHSSDVEIDLYYLIARFLESGPCKKAAKTLIKEIEDYGLLHRSVDWKGVDRKPRFHDSTLAFKSIAPDHLLQLCRRLGPLLDQTFQPPMLPKPSLLGSGRYSVLRTKEDVAHTSWSLKSFAAGFGRRPLVPSHNFMKYNIAYPISGREMGGSRFRDILRPVPTLYGKLKLRRRVLGHLSSVYCVLYDRTGSRIFTGSDDCLVKCWSSRDGRLLSTLRGHQSEICDMDISYENTILASASCDKEIRIWDVRSGKPVTILQSHNAMITSIEFSPLIQGNTRYLISTGRDGNVCFWLWDVETLEFSVQPIKFQERNRPGVAMLCSSCSSGGRFIAVGGSDNLVHVYHIPLEQGGTFIGPLSIAEQDEHKNTVDSLWFAHGGLRFISGSKDGTARIWTFEHSSWTSTVLDVSHPRKAPSEHCDSAASETTLMEKQTSKPMTRSQTNNNLAKVCVIMVAWDCCDENVMTSLTDFSIKVWNAANQKLISTLKGHTDEAYCLEPHPNDRRIFLSAGHDGNVFLWNIISGHTITKFHNMLEGQGHGAVFDAKFSRDGNSFACTDSHGHLLLFGCEDDQDHVKRIPSQLFFHTDYRPLIRDQQGYVLDEQTQQAPHLMPPPFLVDVEGNPYPPELQTLVPGREKCTQAQLIPNLITGENGLPEVLPIEDIEENPVEMDDPFDREAVEVASVLDNMIDRTQHQQRRVSTEGSLAAVPVGLRREGDVAGVRQMHSNAPRSQLASAADIMALTQRVITPQFSPAEQRYREQQRKNRGRHELTWYRTERRKRPPAMQRHRIREVEEQLPSTSRVSRVATKLEKRATNNLRLILREEESEDEDDDSPVRRIRNINAHAHRYSTRSSAPRRRGVVTLLPHLPSLTESVRELDVNMDSNSSGDAETTPVSSSSEENFSLKARILRRSSRSRTAVKRLENASDADESSETSDTTYTEPADHTASTSSLFSSPINASKVTRKMRNGEFRKNRTKARRISSTASWKPEYDSSTCEAEGKSRKKTRIISSESSANEDQPSTSAKCQEVQLQTSTSMSEKMEQPDNAPKKKEVPFQVVSGQGPPAMFLTPDWIKRVTPCNFPFIPQIRDEVVYLRQGHECYIRKVLQEKVWKVSEEDICYKKHPDLGYAEHCLVKKVEYHVGPPTLCEVLLQPMLKKISRKSKDFSVKYHDMPNVVDFFVLKHKYEISTSRSWKANARFRSIIDDVWWYGVVVDKVVYDPAYPDSPFQSLSVLWDSEEMDYLSPWDLEPIPEHTLKTTVSPVMTRSRNPTNCETLSSPSNQTLVESAELCDVIGYESKRGDWGYGRSDDDSEDEPVKKVQEQSRISCGIRQLLSEGMFAPFCTPVDVVAYPTYPLYVAYPTDLSTLLQRLENGFYRRASSLCWEISYLKKNALAFNEPGTVIVKKAELLECLLQSFVKDQNCTDILQLLKIIHRRTSTHGNELSSENDGENGLRKDGAFSRRSLTPEEDKTPFWMKECQKLLDDVMDMADSRPFRHLDVEDSNEDCKPVDLGKIRSRLLLSSYENPKLLRGDVQAIFFNAKRNNPTREVRSMLARLSPLMMSRLGHIITKWETTLTSTKSRSSLRRSNRNRKFIHHSFPELTAPRRSKYASDSADSESDEFRSSYVSFRSRRHLSTRKSNAPNNIRRPEGVRDHLDGKSHNFTQKISTSSEHDLRPNKRSQRNKPRVVETESDSGECSTDKEEHANEDGGEGDDHEPLEPRAASRCKKRARFSDADGRESDSDAGNVFSVRGKKPRLVELSSEEEEEERMEDERKTEVGNHDLRPKKHLKEKNGDRLYARPPTFSKARSGTLDLAPYCKGSVPEKTKSCSNSEVEQRRNSSRIEKIKMAGPEKKRGVKNARMSDSEDSERSKDDSNDSDGQDAFQAGDNDHGTNSGKNLKTIDNTHRWNTRRNPRRTAAYQNGHRSHHTQHHHEAVQRQLRTNRGRTTRYRDYQEDDSEDDELPSVSRSIRGSRHEARRT